MEHSHRRSIGLLVFLAVCLFLGIFVENKTMASMQQALRRTTLVGNGTLAEPPKDDIKNETRTSLEGEMNVEADTEPEGEMNNETGTVDTSDKPILRVFHCGYNYGHSLIESLFPEYTQGEVFTPETITTESDILFKTGNLPRSLCPKVDYGKNLSWLKENFKGKALLVNGESRDDHRGERSYDIGYLQDSNRSIRVHYAALTLFNYGPDWWGKIFNHENKPIGTKKRFMIYAASHCVPFRESAVDELAQIDVVDQGGKCWGRKHDRSKIQLKDVVRAGHHRSNRELFRNYRFCLVMENAKVEGYITEKILNAFLAGCIPIYYGTEEVFEIFNKESFIFYNISKPQPAIDKVALLEANSTAYDEVLSQPILANGSQVIDNYFSLCDDIGNGTLKRRIREMMGLSATVHVAN